MPGLPGLFFAFFNVLSLVNDFVDTINLIAMTVARQVVRCNWRRPIETEFSSIPEGNVKSTSKYSSQKPTDEAEDPYHPISYFQNRLPGSRGAARVHGATISRWILKGIESPHGRIRLAATRAGSRWLIKESDFSAFLEKLTECHLPEADKIEAPTRSSAERHRASLAAARKLKERHGV